MPQAIAGWDGTTAHSRANCLNNESITWWFGHSFFWRVASFHYPEYSDRNHFHFQNSGYTKTWRQGVVHWGEPQGKYWPIGRWYVYAYHFWWDEVHNREVYDTNTDAYDCKIYDGWWDTK